MNEADKELVILAGKAIGRDLEWNACNGRFEYIPTDSKYYYPWDPLKDDGDALRLAVSLHLRVDVGVVSTGIDGPLDGMQDMVLEMFGNQDPGTATRRAIVRAAAAIGAVMK